MSFFWIILLLVLDVYREGPFGKFCNCLYYYRKYGQEKDIIKNYRCGFFKLKTSKIPNIRISPCYGNSHGIITGVYCQSSQGATERHDILMKFEALRLGPICT